MNKLTCTRILEIDAGHRLLKHESKCHNLHGHRYKIEIEVSGAIDKVGRILDFSCIKETVGKWLDDNWDHAFIAERGDPIIEWLKKNKQRMFIMDEAPTAENMAKHLYHVAFVLLPAYVGVESITVWETPNCQAKYIG